MALDSYRNIYAGVCATVWIKLGVVDLYRFEMDGRTWTRKSIRRSRIFHLQQIE